MVTLATILGILLGLTVVHRHPLMDLDYDRRASVALLVWHLSDLHFKSNERSHALRR